MYRLQRIWMGPQRCNIKSEHLNRTGFLQPNWNRLIVVVVWNFRENVYMKLRERPKSELSLVTQRLKTRTKPYSSRIILEYTRRAGGPKGLQQLLHTGLCLTSILRLWNAKSRCRLPKTSKPTAGWDLETPFFAHFCWFSFLGNLVVSIHTFVLFWALLGDLETHSSPLKKRDPKWALWTWRQVFAEGPTQWPKI